MHSLKQYDLWGKPIEEARPSTTIVPLEFEGHSIRMRIANGQSWWVAKDACRLLGIADHNQAVLGNQALGVPGLDEDERGGYIIPTPRGEQKMLCVNESGLYALIFKSRKPEAKRFRKWVTSEVLPSIRKTGTYSVKDAIGREAKRLKSDRATAAKRLENKTKNKEVHARLTAENAAVNDMTAIHNAVHRGQFGRTAAELRETLGMKSGTPLDRMTSVPLAANTMAKAIAERIIEERAKQGQPIPLADQPAIYETTANELVPHTLRPLGDDACYGFSEHPRRGLLLDVIAIQLPSPV